MKMKLSSLALLILCINLLPIDTAYAICRPANNTSKQACYTEVERLRIECISDADQALKT
jgi:hypothetical protein